MGRTVGVFAAALVMLAGCSTSPAAATSCEELAHDVADLTVDVTDAYALDQSVIGEPDVPRVSEAGGGRLARSSRPWGTSCPSTAKWNDEWQIQFSADSLASPATGRRRRSSSA